MNSILWKTVVCALLLIGLGTLSFGQANEVLIDWGAASKQLVAYPPSIDYVTRVTVRVMNVNDLLYEYSGRIAAKPRATSNPTIDEILAGTANLGIAPSSCPDDLVTQLNSFKHN